MRKNMRAILMILAALLYAGTASAYSITAVETSMGSGASGSYLPTDMVVVDIVVDSQPDPLYGFAFLVEFDPTVLSPVGGSLSLPGTLNEYSSLYLYPSSWYILGIGLSGPVPAGTYTVANLVFHVMNVANSAMTSLTPSFNAPYANFVVQQAGLPIDVMGSVALNSATIHVPEPTTTMLMGLGLFGILYAGRRR